MKRILLLIPACLTAALLGAQTTDSIGGGKAGVADVAESDPNLFLVMMVMALGVITLFLLGLVAAMIVLVIFALLAGAGIVSLSAFVGLYKRSATAGIRTFVFTSFGVVGLLAGLAGYYIYVRINHLIFNWQDAVVAGMPIGLAIGLVAAWVGIVVFRYLFRYLSGWLRNKLPGA